MEQHEGSFNGNITALFLSGMNLQKPLISVGMPVYNGGNFIVDSVESILNQTYSNIELIISDNASTDNTESICREYVSVDKRVKYCRHESNIGAIVNHNHVLNFSQGKYFKWMCHDDRCEKTFVEKSVDVLDSDDKIICCFSKIKFIDENDKVLRMSTDQLSVLCDCGLERLRNYVYLQRQYPDIYCAMAGLFRTNSIKSIGQLGTYIAGDQVFLLKMINEGKLYQLTDPLLSRREHPNTAFVALPKLPYYKKYKEATRWGETKNNPMVVLVNWKLMGETLHYFIGYPMVLMDKINSLMAILGLFAKRWKQLVRELTTIPGQIFYHVFIWK